MYTGLTPAICAQAWAITVPSIERAASMHTTVRLAGTIIVLDPWSGGVMFRAQIDDEHPDAALFDEIAEGKAEVSWETGLSSHEVQQRAPHLYKPNWVKWGGAVIKYKLVVAFSGVQAVFDEAIAETEQSWIFGICRNEMTKVGGVMTSDSNRIPVGTRKGHGMAG